MMKRTWILAGLLCLISFVDLPAQQRTPIVQVVDLLMPMAPMTIPIAGKTHVVYELHITNFLPVDAVLSRLQVLAAGQSGISIADYRGGEIIKRIGRPGLRRDHPSTDVIGPGMRAVVYLWIELADASAVPAALRHRLELDILRPTGSVRAVVEDRPRNLSTDAPVVLHPPLRGGPWTAIYDPLLMGGHRTAIYTLDGHARIPARFAIDWIRVPPSGAIEKDPARRSPDWNGYGAEVLAVADAVVAAAMDDIPENADDAATAKPVAPENASGNYVALDLGRGQTAFYEHLKRGSVTVKTGDRVKAGQVIGQLGNSGSSSIGPHLHFHVSDANSPLAAEGLPFVFTRFQQLGAFPSLAALIGGSAWVVNPDRRAITRSLERPGANSVIQFVQGPAVGAAQDASFNRARANSRLFERAVHAAQRVLHAWLKHADPETQLLPDRPLADRSRLVYTPHNSGADLYPYLILTSHLTDPDLYRGRMMEMLRNEVRYTSATRSIPGDLNLATRVLGSRSFFGAGEYAKDGLIAVTEYLGRTPWFYRMVDMIADAMTEAPVATRFGSLPAADAETNGDYLQALVRIAAMTGDRRFLEWARRIGDAYIEEVLPGSGGVPGHTWDFQSHKGERRLRLRDHGNETIVGLVMLFALEHQLGSPRAASYRPVIQRMLDRVLASANADGLLYNEVNVDTLEPIDRGLSDNWSTCTAPSTAITL